MTHEALSAPAYTSLVRPGLLYGLIRLGTFAVVFALLLLITPEWWIAALCAAVVSFCVGYIFFGRVRRAAAEAAAARRGRPEADPDAGAEDSESDRQPQADREQQ